MWSAKKLLIGSLAVGGVAAMGYFAYRYYKSRNVCPVVAKDEENEEDNESPAVCVQNSAQDIVDSELEQDKENLGQDEVGQERQEAAEEHKESMQKFAGGCNQNVLSRVKAHKEKISNAAMMVEPAKCVPLCTVMDSVVQLQVDEEVESTAAENIKVDTEPVNSVAVEADAELAAKNNAKIDAEIVAEENDKADMEFEAGDNAQVGEEICTEGNAKVDAEAAAEFITFGNAESVEPAAAREKTEAQPVQIFPPIPRPRCLRHVGTLKELDMAFEALSAYLFTQNRSTEELKEAEKELGWVWHVALGYRHRLPNNVPLLLINKEDNNLTALPLEDADGMQSVD